MTETTTNQRKRKGLLFAEIAVVLALALVIGAYFVLTSGGGSEYVIHDGDDLTCFSSASTEIDEVLAEAGIAVGENDRITSAAHGSTTEITIQRQNNVTVSLAGTRYEAATYGATVQQLLSEMDISLSEQDTMVSDGQSLAPSDKLSDGMDIEITQNAETTVTETIDIPYDSVVFLDPSLAEGTRTVKTPGSKGQQEIISLEKYVNGELVSSTVLSSRLLSTPVTEVILVGSGAAASAEAEDAVSTAPAQTDPEDQEVEVPAETQEEPETSEPEYDEPEEPVEEPDYEEPESQEPEPEYDEPADEEPEYQEPEPEYDEPADEEPEYQEPEPEYEEPQEEAPAPSGNYITTSSGEVLYYSNSFTVEATAYTGGGTTATGTPARYGAIAVDPSVIPYGTKMYIVSNDGNWVYGVATAEDCGGAINGYIVDLYFDDYSTCIQFGRRNCTVYILE